MSTEQREGKLNTTWYTISDIKHLFLQKPQLKQKKVEDELMAIIVGEDEY